MARRVSNSGIQVEQMPTEKRRVSAAGVMVEYGPAFDEIFPTGIASAEAFGTATLQTGPVTVECPSETVAYHS